jgi:hypothetical protein
MEMNNRINNNPAGKHESIIDQEFSRPENSILRFGSLFMLVLICVTAISLSIVTVDRRVKIKVILERTGDYETELSGGNKYEFLCKEGYPVSRGTRLVRWTDQHGNDTVLLAPIAGKFSKESVGLVNGSQKSAHTFVRIGAINPGIKVHVLMNKAAYEKDLTGSKVNFWVIKNKELASIPLKATVLLREDYQSFSDQQSWLAELKENSDSVINKYSWKEKELSGEGTIVLGTQMLLMQLMSKK